MIGIATVGAGLGAADKINFVDAAECAAVDRITGTQNVGRHDIAQLNLERLGVAAILCARDLVVCRIALDVIGAQAGFATFAVHQPDFELVYLVTQASVLCDICFLVIVVDCSACLYH